MSPSQPVSTSASPSPTTSASPASGTQPDAATVAPAPTVACDLCEAARLTPWYLEDDLCWVAECEFCSVPMVVLRDHDANPPDAVKATLHERLAAVVSEYFDFDHWVDDNMRNIPDHYHAHARRRHRMG